MIHIHFTGTAHSPTLQLKRGPHPMTSLRITHAPNNVVTLTGTTAQIKRLIFLARDSARVNFPLSRPTTHITQQELNDLNDMYEEWFTL